MRELRQRVSEAADAKNERLSKDKMDSVYKYAENHPVVKALTNELKALESNPLAGLQASKTGRTQAVIQQELSKAYSQAVQEKAAQYGVDLGITAPAETPAPKNRPPLSSFTKG